MNKAIITGNITRDIELRHTKTQGVPVCSFSVAVNRRRRDADGNLVTDFIDVQAWGKTAEACAKYLRKGRKVGVVGELHSNHYEKDGVKRLSFQIDADEIEFLSPKDSSAGSEQYAPMPQDLADAGFEGITDEELPF